MKFEELRKYLLDTDADARCSMEEAIYLHLEEEKEELKEMLNSMSCFTRYKRGNDCIESGFSKHHYCGKCKLNDR